jgi:N-acetylmuramoyl-L-alanine amidase
MIRGAMKIVNHLLCKDDGTPYPFEKTPNQGGAITPQFLVLHFTASHSARVAISWLTNPEAKASAHVVIARDGTITQLVPFNLEAWHAGKSHWAGHDGLNKYSLGIELDNAGKLKREGSKWVTWNGKPIPDNEVMEATHKNETEKAGWHTFSEAQLKAARELSALLIQTYNLKDIIGHEDIAPGRKTDPGPAFPMKDFRTQLIGREETAPATVYSVTATLKVHCDASLESATVAGSPLPAGTKVAVLSKQGDWCRVDVCQPVNGHDELHGWVHAHYLKQLT